MKPTSASITFAFAALTILAFNVNAQDPKGSAPKAPAQDMKGHDMSKMQGHDMKGHSAGSMELHKIMTSGMKMPMKMSGNVDQDFATMMTMHHQQAIKMSAVLIEHGSNAELKALARKMKTDQQAEIQELAPHTK